MAKATSTRTNWRTPFRTWNACRLPWLAGATISRRTGAWRRKSENAWRKSGGPRKKPSRTGLPAYRLLLRIQFQINNRLFARIERTQSLGIAGSAALLVICLQLVIHVRAQFVKMEDAVGL